MSLMRSHRAVVQGLRRSRIERPARCAVHRRRLRFDDLELRTLLSITGSMAENPITPHPVAGTSFTATVATFTSNDTGPFMPSSIGATATVRRARLNLSARVTISLRVRNTSTAPTLAGNYNNVTVTLVDSTDPPGTPATVVNSGAIVDDAPITTSSVDFTESRGASFSTDVATFTDGNPYAASSSLSATINWGDGTAATAGTVTEGANSVFHVLGTHSYAQSGTFAVTVNVSSIGGSTAVTSPPSSATVVNSNITRRLFRSWRQPGRPSATTSFPPSPMPAARCQRITTPPSSIGRRHGEYDGYSHACRRRQLRGARRAYLHSGGQLSCDGADRDQQRVIGDGLEPGDRSAVAPIATAINFTIPERQQFSGAVATFTQAAGTTAPPASDYLATIDWGDGSCAYPGDSLWYPGAYVVSGIHTYGDISSATSVIYPVTVSIHDLVGGTYAQVFGNATVTAVTINLTGFLNSATDTGVSNTDAITRDDQPAFFGTSESYTNVSVFAQPVGGGSSILLGKTETNSSGAWSIVSSVPLADGDYTIQATAVDQGGVNSTTIQVLPNSTQGPLVIDTVGPKVTDVVFNRLQGQIVVTFQDYGGVNNTGVGMDLASEIDANNYQLTTVTTPRIGKYRVNAISVVPGTTTGTQTATLTINHGGYIKGGWYFFTIFSTSPTNLTGVQDIAGNGLDGEFYGYFSSGNNVPGGNFVAQLTAFRHTIFAPSTIIGRATPVSPPGTRPGSIHLTQTINPGKLPASLKRKRGGMRSGKPMSCSFVTRTRSRIPSGANAMVAVSSSSAAANGSSSIGALGSLDEALDQISKPTHHRS